MKTDHLEILRQHNAWRRGEVDENPHAPKEIGMAIDAAIGEVEALRTILRQVEPIVSAHAGATHMLDGFKPKRNQSDELAERIQALNKGGPADA